MADLTILNPAIVNNSQNSKKSNISRYSFALVGGAAGAGA